MSFTQLLDISISFSETSSDDAKFIYEVLSPKFSVYNYKNWLDEQSGKKIVTFSEEIYTQIPCIILVTEDWFYRDATILEARFLSRNDSPKLIYDYIDIFEERNESKSINNYSYGKFSEHDMIDKNALLEFAHRAYNM